jgi:thymidylate synthase
MNQLDLDYQTLLKDILENGVEKETRNGGTISVFGRQIRYKFKDGKFPLLTTKKMYFKGIVTELLWFLKGDSNIRYLVDNGCHIWNGDAYKNYCKIAGSMEEPDYNIHIDDPNQNCMRLMTMVEFIDCIKKDNEFAKKWGELGPLYGKQWRKWNQYTEVCVDNDWGNGNQGGAWVFKQIDQIQNLIDDLKNNPDSRRLIVSAWNVGEIEDMTLPPCHYGFQCYTRELTFEERWELSIKYGYTKEGTEMPSPDATYLGLNERSELEYMWNDSVIKTDLPKRAISLMWNQRSVDTFLGLPFNIASYGLLLEIIAKIVNMVPDELIGNLGDTHLYLNHIEQAKEQIGRKIGIEEKREMLKTAMGEESYKDAVSNLMPFGGGMSEYFESFKIPYYTREPYSLPKLVHGKTDAFYKTLSEDLSLFGHLDPDHFRVENYQSHPAIKAPLSN